MSFMRSSGVHHHHHIIIIIIIIIIIMFFVNKLIKTQLEHCKFIKLN